MKVTGAPPPPISAQGITSGSSLAGAYGASTAVHSIHLDTARHGVDATTFLRDLRSSPDLAQMRSDRQTGATELRNSMIRTFGSDVVQPLFKDDLHGASDTSGRKP